MNEIIKQTILAATLFCGDSREVLKGIEPNSIDSVVCDPPYELTGSSGSGGFMDKKWDSTGIAFDPTLWAEILRVLKPGGHLLAFGGSRTYHRMACAIEDAGFEIRDQIMWLYGSGFPKSHNLEGDWDGWGTALKPAHEPIVVARRPLIDTVAENVQQHGTGALNIDGCRVGTEERTYAPKGTSANAVMIRVPEHRAGFAGDNVTVQGRWPANVIHDGSEEVLAEFAKYGESSTKRIEKPSVCDEEANTWGGTIQRNRGPRGHTDSGTAARFFYCAKASKKDRGEGNTHPTVKPTDLMRYLVRLVTPPNGVCLDPFLGSGSTGRAALLEGFRFIGIEREPDYFAIACSRVAQGQEQPEMIFPMPKPAPKPEPERQPDLFRGGAA